MTGTKPSWITGHTVVDQDSAGIPCSLATTNDDCVVYVKPLGGANTIRIWGRGPGSTCGRG